jgi:hypothetical protein
MKIDDPHDDPFADAPDDPEFTNERCWERDGSMRRRQPVAFTIPPASLDPDAPIAEQRFTLDWIDQQRVSPYPADPTYPEGCAIDVALDAGRACRVELPCPAARCGLWVVTCRACGYAIALATAGRADDPRSVRVPCKTG